jgi:spermidine synthase
MSEAKSNPLLVGLYRRFVEKRRQIYKAKVGSDLIEVVSIRGELFLLHNGVTQSREKIFAEGYWKFWSLLPSTYVNPDILVIGLGGGTICRIFESLYDEYHIDAVEINGLVISLAEKFFGLRAGDRLRIYNEDAKDFIEKTTETYDVVVLDVYNGIEMPANLYSKAFFDSLAERMKDGATLSINLAPAMRTHLGEIFANLASYPSKFFVISPGNNVVVFCSRKRLSAERFIEGMRKGSNSIKVNQESASLVHYFEAGLVEVDASVKDNDS